MRSIFCGNRAEAERVTRTMQLLENHPCCDAVLDMLERTNDYDTALRVAKILAEGVDARFYGARPINRRRTRNQLDWLRAACIAVVFAYAPISVRGAFYRLVTLDAVPKTEEAYKTVGRLLVELREEEYIPYRLIADNSRYVARATTYSGLPHLLQEAQRFYRRRLWESQPVQAVVMIEKDALAGTVRPVTHEWDVPLAVCRGFPSVTMLHEIAEDITTVGKPCYVYVFTDYDPSGLAIYDTVAERLREFVDGVELNITRVAVTPQQVMDWDLPTHPTKTTDSRAGRFSGESCELDAIPPDVLRRLVEDCITRHVNELELQHVLAVEEAERETLRKIQQQLEVVS